ncbi:MAG TPA: hypothetical protein VIM63_00560, partial [Rhodoferax sp.]
VWIYLAWVIVLLGALIAAYLPSLLAGVQRRARAHGWQFLLALEMLQHLERMRLMPERGLSLEQLSALLQVDPLQLEPALEALVELDWIGQLEEDRPDAAPRLVLLADPDTTLLAPLFNVLLLQREASTDKLWENGSWPLLTLRQAL